MSRAKKWKLSDFDKYMKPLHLAGQQHQLTITHVGIEQVKNRKREFVIAGEAPDGTEDDLLLILHFREWPKPLRVNNMNRAKLMESVGEDPSALIGCKITLRPVTLRQFGGQEAIDIVSVERPKPEPGAHGPVEGAINGRAALLKRLSDLRARERELLADRGIEPTPLTSEMVKAMTDVEIQERIDLAENNIDNLEHA